MKRWLLAFTAAAAVIFALPRVFKAEMFRPAIHRGLEDTLGRKVEINGGITYLLFPRPGFSVAGAVIHEHPSVGVEPFAYVGELDFHVSLTGLLRGRVDLAGIRMYEPHVNLMKPGQSIWNFQPFLDHALGPKRTGTTLPAIEIRGGRLNFKSGDVKSVLYLSETDLTVEADPDSPDRFGIQFEGEPARTDRGVRSLGRVSGRGMLTVGRTSGAESRIELSLNTERTALSEVITLIQGRGSGLRGFVSSRLKLSGPLSAIQIEGSIQTAEFERLGWLLPGGSGAGVPVRGKLDLPGQTMTFETVAPGGAAMPVSLRARASRFLGVPSWAMLITVNDLPLASVRWLLAEAGIPLPADLPAEGKLSGAVGYDTARGMQGEMKARQGALQMDGLPPVRFESASVVVDGPVLELRPAAVRIGEARGATVEARYNSVSGEREASIQTQGVELAELRGLWKAVAAGPMPEMLDRAVEGSLQGAIRCKPCGEAGAQWTADTAVRGLRIALDGLPATVLLESGLVSLRGTALAARRLEGRLGTLRWTGEVAVPAANQAKFNLEFPEANSSQLEAFLSPAFERQQGLIARTILRRSGPLPEWLRLRRADGRVKIRQLQVGPQLLEAVSFAVNWTGPKIEITNWQSRIGDGQLLGALTADLAGRAPVYKGRVEASAVPWQEGRLDGGAAFETSGAGSQLIPRLSAQGTFAARDVVLAPDTEWRTASGSFSYTGASRLQITGIEAAIGPDSYQGAGAANADGRLAIELASAQRQLRLAGRISGQGVELRPAR